MQLELGRGWCRRWASNLNLTMRFIFLLLGLLLLCGDACAQFESRIAPDEIKQASKSEVPTIAYCELVRNPKRYDREFIRVRGSYLVREEHSNLYDLSCLTNPTAKDTDSANLG
jgi:hypothetical protein